MTRAVAGAMLACSVMWIAAAAKPGPKDGKSRNVATAGVRTPAREAMDVTVRLFANEAIATMYLSSEGAGARWCAGCAVQAPGQTMTVTAAPSGGVALSGGPTAERLFFNGQVKAWTPDGRFAEVAGRWTISAGKGGLRVRVEVPSERYVMAVLAGEAGPNEPAESLKALAVVARSFAMQNPQRHGTDGLCDSTHCQVLRFGPVREGVRRAVEATSGETLWYGGRKTGEQNVQQVSGYFTENCGGQSEDAAALWGGAGEPWLSTHPDPYCVRSPAFWHADLELEQVRRALSAEGLAVPSALLRLVVTGRDSSGRVAMLALRGGDGSTRETSAASLRFAVDRAYGWNQLRSDLYQVATTGDRVVFDGRGYGHGVGLCQAGARAMASQGKNYREILRAYFPGTDVRVQGGDRGWSTQNENGWTLRAVSDGVSTTALAEQGNVAWAQARAAFPGTGIPAPQVTVYPTTELFRQGAGAPGWELAATRGSVIALQRLDVMKRGEGRHGQTAGQRGPAEDVLRHEFLHVLVESEAGPRTPLWLREGLVEVLAGEPCAAKAHGRMHPDMVKVEASLALPVSWTESQRSHAMACGMVQRDVSRYGAAAVRGWLRDGVPAVVLTIE